ncbi:hypothetical protein PEC106568_26150 [Pectobacterium carotovorum subsp. carotovorum]|uniref:hypothetical protein n=1 Tax=Pectobacterium brasiliense TaxID=180957 RepID=UPI002085D6A6|nr:hypothetical protein PEC106568_26150 [Pectobacterium carotovorum subsp. carotovorum]
MADMNIEFIGGNLDGQIISPINKEELSGLGYRLQLKGEARGNELAHCIAVPIEWTPEEGHKAIMEKYRRQ